MSLTSLGHTVSTYLSILVTQTPHFKTVRTDSQRNLSTANSNSPHSNPRLEWKRLPTHRQANRLQHIVYVKYSTVEDNANSQAIINRRFVYFSSVNSNVMGSASPPNDKANGGAGCVVGQRVQSKTNGPFASKRRMSRGEWHKSKGNVTENAKHRKKGQLFVIITENVL